MEAGETPASFSFMKEELVVVAVIIVKNGRVYELHRKLVAPYLWDFLKRAHPAEQKKAIEQDTELVGSIYRLVSFKRMLVSHARGLKLGIIQRMTKEQADETPFLL